MAAKPVSIGEVIDASEVTIAPRGRKAVLDSALTDAFSKLGEGKAIRLGDYFGPVNDEATKQKVGSIIRKNWKAVRHEPCRIVWGSGSPEVSAKPVKADAE
jgi:hypothetical protein